MSSMGGVPYFKSLNQLNQLNQPAFALQLSQGQEVDRELEVIPGVQ